MIKKVSDYISDFLNYLTEIETSIKFNINEQKRCEDETQDILHELELGNALFDERAKMATKLAKIRRERRKYKDLVEEQQALFDWISTNKGSINQLKNVLGETRKQEKYHGNRSYNKKVID